MALCTTACLAWPLVELRAARGARFRPPQRLRGRPWSLLLMAAELLPALSLVREEPESMEEWWWEAGDEYHELAPLQQRALRTQQAQGRRVSFVERGRG
ncbi:hypothetical protein GQ55_9G439300 [Panicum hallii var. hallii]|uniref:Uncharacterized protein n=2 Tax=Panicum hallii var. hallii TaxID=1504633 RepID=A0A2T7CBK1_9POAL|nr:hypothetical protein GQ55_9G439300 [Panicum hallii var. hallii]